MLHNRLLPVAIALAAALTACSDSTQPTDTPSPTDDPQLRSAQGQQPAGPLALARSVHGFGGFFLDEQGSPTVYLKDPAERGNAVRALAPWLRSRGRRESDLRVLPGQFGWSELEQWQRAATPAALAIPGAVFVDADEAANRLRVGVEHGAAGAQARGAISRLGIPAGAVEVTVTERVEPVIGLRDRVSPTLGGIQINFDPDLSVPGSFVCTLGFNAIRNAQESFVTNSHCTNINGGTERSPYWQPLRSLFPDPIAIEVDDPDFTTGGDCPAGRRCRFSDAARARYERDVDVTLGAIARTEAPTKSKLDIVGTFQITGESNAQEFVINEIANKVGRTTGWSQGKIVATCVNTNSGGTDKTLFCQTFVAAHVGGGDSGSPVFAENGDGTATLYGILWGGTQGGNFFVFSPLANVEQELGALQTH